MQIVSNVRAVIDRTRRLRDRDIPTAMQRALNPALWKEIAGETATATLNAIATGEQRQFIAAFVATLVAGVFQNGFFLRLRTPFLDVKALEDYRGARAGLSPADGMESLFLKDVQQFEELMAEWVATEKKKDKRDVDKTDEEIGAWISYILLAPESKLTPKERNARKGFMRHIPEFIRRKQSVARLDADTVDGWLRAVLSAWKLMVRDHYPKLLHEQLRGAKTELPL